MKKALLFLTMLLALVASFAMAGQETPALTIDVALVGTILSGAWLFGGGVPVAALSEIVKRFLFKTEPRPKWSGYLCSTLVAIACTAAALVILKRFDLAFFIVTSIAVAVEANGLYKFAAK